MANYVTVTQEQANRLNLKEGSTIEYKELKDKEKELNDNEGNEPKKVVKKKKGTSK
jgi:hypothetical protein